MPGLKACLRLWSIWLALSWVGPVAAAGADWKLLDLGPFSLRAPAAMVLTRGGSDSMAGTLTGDDLRLDYDFGLYADPLQAREGAKDFEARDGTVDGLPARFVSYRMTSSTGQIQLCTGVHVPQASRSVPGRIGLSMLACGGDANSMQRARAIFSTLRFRADAPR